MLSGRITAHPVPSILHWYGTSDVLITIIPKIRTVDTSSGNQKLSMVR